MTFLYTTTAPFDKSYIDDPMSWEKYIKWSKLTHLTELVSLDGILNKMLVVSDYDNADYWDYIHTVGEHLTGFFTSLEYVLRKTKPNDKFNLLTVVIEPGEDCSEINVDGYAFMGYDLLDKDFSISALTNCGGFVETFLPIDLNKFGLIDDYTKAYQIKKDLLENNPEEHHADTNVIAVWRHKTIGR